MTIIERDTGGQRPRIDLQGPDGNPFALIGYGKNWGKQLGWSKEEIKAFTEKALKCDYDQLLELMEEKFGKVADFIK